MRHTATREPGSSTEAEFNEVEAARLATLALRQSKRITQADLLRCRHIVATRTEALRKQAVDRSRAGTYCTNWYQCWCYRRVLLPIKASNLSTQYGS